MLKIWYNKKEMRAKRAENFGYGGGQMFWWGGTQDFHDGGGQVLMGGYKVLMGGVPPHPPPILDNPGSCIYPLLRYFFSHLILSYEQGRSL